MWEKCPKILTDKKLSQNFNSHKYTHTERRRLWECKKTPKRHFASSGKERLEWKGECSPEAWWIDEWREGERVKASRRQRRPCLVVGWVREGGALACWEIDRLLSAKPLSLTRCYGLGKGHNKGKNDKTLASNHKAWHSIAFTFLFHSTAPQTLSEFILLCVPITFRTEERKFVLLCKNKLFSTIHLIQFTGLWLL